MKSMAHNEMLSTCSPRLCPMLTWAVEAQNLLYDLVLAPASCSIHLRDLCVLLFGNRDLQQSV